MAKPVPEARYRPPGPLPTRPVSQPGCAPPWRPSCPVVKVRRSARNRTPSGGRGRAAARLSSPRVLWGRWHGDDPRISPVRSAAPGVDPPAGGQVVADRPERPPPLNTLTFLERVLVQGWGRWSYKEVPGWPGTARPGRSLPRPRSRSDETALNVKPLEPAATTLAVESSGGRRFRQKQKSGLGQPVGQFTRDRFHLALGPIQGHDQCFQAIPHMVRRRPQLGEFRAPHDV